MDKYTKKIFKIAKNQTTINCITAIALISSGLCINSLMNIILDDYGPRIEKLEKEIAELRKMMKTEEK